MSPSIRHNSQLQNDLQRRGTPVTPISIRPVFRPFELRKGEVLKLRWSGVKASTTFSFKNKEVMATSKITIEGLNDWHLVMTGVSGEQLVMDQAGGFPNIRFVWVDQPYEIRDSLGNVWYQSKGPTER